MNELAFLSMVLVSAVRLIGLGVSLDYYFGSKKRKFILISFGWFIFFIADLLIIVLNFYNNIFFYEFLLILNAILTVIGCIFVIFGIISYFIKITIRIIFLYIIILLTGTIFIWFIFDYKNAINFSLANLILFYLYALLLSIFKRSQFKKHMGRSFKWYYITSAVFSLYIPVSIIAVLQGYSFGLYYAENNTLIILYYTIAISSTILIILVLIHTEYSISLIQKNQLKDKYSHDLGNALQAIFSCFDLMKAENRFDQKMDTNLDDILKSKLKEASNLIKEIRSL